MTGLEIGGLALGVVPIVVAAAGAYRTLHDRLNTLRHRHRVAQRLWLKYRFIQTRIRTAFRHFFTPVLQENDPWQYMQQTGLSAQQQKDVADYIDQKLGPESASMFADVFSEISTILGEAQIALVHVASLASANTVPSTSKTKNTKDAVDIALHEPKYEKQLEELRLWVGDLCELLSMRGSTPTEEQVNGTKQKLPLPSSVTAINEASKELGIGLEKAWTCLNSHHGSHNAVLRFDAQLDMKDNVHMNVAISCRSSDSAAPQTSHERHVLLHVKSVAPPVDWENKNNKRVKTSTATSRSTATNNGHILQYSSAISRATTTKTTILQDLRQEHELAYYRQLEGIPSVCCHLCSVNFSIPIQTSKCCLSHVGSVCGYIGRSSGYEHVVYHKNSRSTLDQESPAPTSSSKPVSRYLGHMTVAQQLHTAYEVTMGLLKYNSTPWLSDEWSLSDISYLDSSSFDHTTLHLTKRLTVKKTTSQVQLDIGPVPNPTSNQELRTLLGIRNAPLANLGHALLELAHRKPLKHLRQPSDPSNTVTARRLINGHDTMFGARYRNLVRKCLEADFVTDCTDLMDGRLQTAVYNDVALELDSLAKEIDRTLSLI